VGNGYITGSTFSTDFPTSRGALQRTYRSGVPGCPPTCPFVSSSGFVVKLRPNGTVVYSTYFGSGGNEGDGIAVDARGDAYVSSSSWSRCRPAGPTVSELGPGGTHLLFTTCLKPPLPGAGFGPGGPVALQGNRLLVGGNACVAALDLATHRVLWTLHLPGHVNGLAADNDGRVDATGITNSRAFPVVHAIQSHLHVATCGVEDASHSCTDAFVVQVSPAGRLLFSSYLGGTHDDAGQGVAAPGPERMIVTGDTASGDFPVSRALQAANYGGGDPNSYNGGGLNGFVTKIVLSGS